MVLFCDYKLWKVINVKSKEKLIEHNQDWYILFVSQIIKKLCFNTIIQLLISLFIILNNIFFYFDQSSNIRVLYDKLEQFIYENLRRQKDNKKITIIFFVNIKEKNNSINFFILNFHDNNNIFTPHSYSKSMV